MSVAAPRPRLAARSRSAAAYALAALTFVLAFLGATSERTAAAHVAAIQVHASAAKIARSPANTPDFDHRDPRAHLVTDGPDEKADLGGRAPTPTSALRSRGDGRPLGELPDFFSLALAARCLPPAATAAVLDCASGARIAALHERAFQITPPREPNPARGPPRL